MIEQNKIVSIEYEVFNQEDNTLLDSNKGGAPLDFLVGSGQVISGLENALMGANVGDNIKATIAPEDAYGTYQSDFVQEVPRDQFEGIELKAGMTLFGQGVGGGCGCGSGGGHSGGGCCGGGGHSGGGCGCSH